jgi:hypothetical protein
MHKNLVGSKSPASIFIKVVLPAPLGPVIAYRRPAMKLQVKSSNRILLPYRMVMLLTESIALNYSVNSLRVLGAVRACNSHSDPCVSRALSRSSIGKH